MVKAQQETIEQVDLPSPRYEYGGDEFVFVELDQAMSFQATFKAMAICAELRKKELPGIVEICPANASYLVRIDPDELRADDLIVELRAIDDRVGGSAHSTFKTRVVDVPVMLEDPWTLEVMQRFADRRQNPEGTDAEYAARINGFKTTADFLQALHGSPYFVTMVGFVPGTPWCLQLLPRERIIQVPKYVRPRTDTPERAFGFGGAFGCIYPVRGPGGFQLFGIVAPPIFDPKQELEDFRDLFVFPRPGDIFKFRPVGLNEYEVIRRRVEDRTFRYHTHEVEFDPEAFFADPDAFNQNLLTALYSD
jgi:allophanate hydrolase subunit 1